MTIGVWLAAVSALTSPISISTSPDKQFDVRVFSAGQSTIPPDYRADVSFVLRRHNAWFWSDTVVAKAALADGWTVKWTTPRTIGIEAGPLSYFSFVAAHVGDVAVSVHVSSRSPEEARCIGQAVLNTINGIVCFDALLSTRRAPEAATP